MTLTIALSHIKFVHCIVFGTSWVLFLLMGKIFFEYVLGSYHSSGSRLWALVSKSLFLTTFVTACTLLELISLEILEIMHPELRALLWALTLGLLSFLLNICIPASIAISIGFQMELPLSRGTLYAFSFVLFAQMILWSAGELLPLSSNQSSHPSFLSYILSLPFNVPQSVAHLTVIGTATAAVISGFATVSFPLQQLLVMRGLSSDMLHQRESLLANLLEEICRLKKKKFCTHPTQNQRLYSDFRRNASNSFIKKNKSFRPSLSFADILNSIPLFRNIQDFIRRRFYPSIKRKDSSPHLRRHAAEDSYRSDQRHPFSSSGTSTFSLIESQEQLSRDIFSEIVQLKELLAQAAQARTLWGRLLHIAGYLCSFLGVFRVYVGTEHIVSHLLNTNSAQPYATSTLSGEKEAEDLVSFAHKFLIKYLHFNVANFLWPPALTFLLVGTLSLLQVKVFMTTVRDFAAFGFLSTNTEVYALCLSHFVGVYFVACVLLLRIQLPPRRRLAVTFVLGMDINFDFYLLWFDLFFVLSAIFFGMGLLIYHTRKQR